MQNFSSLGLRVMKSAISLTFSVNSDLTVGIKGIENFKQERLA
jgi:hypothetical protein